MAISRNTEFENNLGFLAPQERYGAPIKVKCGTKKHTIGPLSLAKITLIGEGANMGDQNFRIWCNSRFLV